MKVVFDHKEPTAKNLKTFWFKPERPVEYLAGQYTEIRLPHDNPDERGDKRWFTLSSSPTDEMVSITTKIFPEHSTFKGALDSLKTATPLTLADPMGDFVLPKDKTIPLLFIAGGIGVTPMHSMIKWLKDTGEERQIHLVYAVNDLEDMAFRDLFESYSLKFTPLVTNPSKDWKGETGRLSGERIMQFMNGDPRELVYISGPELMVKQFATDLQKLGIKSSRIVIDDFPGYSEI
jgi:ferredoxin-NADP reductase